MRGPHLGPACSPSLAFIVPGVAVPSGACLSYLPMLENPAEAAPRLNTVDDPTAPFESPLLLLRLTAYAADAMRVLTLLEQQAAASPALEASIRAACPDWRNPGTLDDPADLIAMSLAQAVQGLTEALWQQSATARPSTG